MLDRGNKFTLTSIMKLQEPAEPRNIPATVRVSHKAELIKHVVNKTKDVFRGTRYENSCYFYHDVLSQMTNKDM